MKCFHGFFRVGIFIIPSVSIRGRPKHAFLGFASPENSAPPWSSWLIFTFPICSSGAFLQVARCHIYLRRILIHQKKADLYRGNHRARTQEFDEIESANNIIQHYPTMIGMQTDVSPLRPGMISVFLDIRNPKINNVPSRSFMLRPIDRKLSRTD